MAFTTRFNLVLVWSKIVQILTKKSSNWVRHNQVSWSISTRQGSHVDDKPSRCLFRHCTALILIHSSLVIVDFHSLLVWVSCMRMLCSHHMTSSFQKDLRTPSPIIFMSSLLGSYHLTSFFQTNPSTPSPL